MGYGIGMGKIIQWQISLPENKFLLSISASLDSMKFYFLDIKRNYIGFTEKNRKWLLQPRITANTCPGLNYPQHIVIVFITLKNDSVLISYIFYLQIYNSVGKMDSVMQHLLW